MDPARSRVGFSADVAWLGPGAVAHQADGVELGLLAGVLLGALARLVALVEQLDLLQLLEGLAERRLGVVELDA